MPSIITLVRGDDPKVAIGLLGAQFREHSIGLGEARLASAVLGLLAAPERGAMLIARELSEPLGIAVLAYTWTLEHGGLVAWLDELYVVPAARGRGVGRALLDTACSEASRRGCLAVELEVDRAHGRAEGLYERAGFIPLPRARWSRALRTSSTDAM